MFDYVELAKSLDKSGRYTSADKITNILSSKFAQVEHYDWLSDDKFRNELNNVGTKEDIDDFALYSDMYGDDFPAGDSVMELQQRVKILNLEREAWQEQLGEYLIADSLTDDEIENKRNAEERINQLNVEIEEIYRKLNN
jgi:hypothetical protein